MTFPADHPIELLRGLKRPKPTEVRRAAAIRVAYVADKLVRRAGAGEPTGFLLDELSALAVLVETFDEAQAARAKEETAIVVADAAARAPGEPCKSCGSSRPHASCSAKSWVIEFRSGSHFQNLEGDRGGPMETAMRFPTKTEAETFMRAHEWILFNGGMAVVFKP